MVTTGKPQRTLIAAAFFGIAAALAVPSLAQAQNHQMVSQPPTGAHGASIGGSSSGDGTGSRYAGVLSHALTYSSGQGQSQGLRPGDHPPPPHRSTKPPL
jgi:hypothetical protein